MTSELTVVAVRANILIAFELRRELCDDCQYVLNRTHLRGQQSPRGIQGQDPLWRLGRESQQNHVPCVPNVIQKAMIAVSSRVGVMSKIYRKEQIKGYLKIESEGSGIEVWRRCGLATWQGARDVTACGR